MMLVVYGPTATGKTDLAIRLAKKFNGEIISADSRQVYKGLDIGTGKVSFSSNVERHNGYWIVDDVRINGFDLVSPPNQFTVANFLKFTQTTINRIIVAGKTPIIVGGTGFYIKALLDGLESIGIPKDPKLRSQLEKLPRNKLYQKLLAVDEKRARSMNESDRKNPRRLIRAIEIATSREKLGTKKSYNASYPLQTTNYQLIGLSASNDYLYNKVDKWLEERLEAGMIKEVEHLISMGIDLDWLDKLGLEYRWISRFVRGKISQQVLTERLKGDIHNFIRRQKTWFKKFKNVKMYDISGKSWEKKIEVYIKKTDCMNSIADIYST